MKEKDSYEKAMHRALARKPFLKSDGQYLSREEIHRRGGAVVDADAPSSRRDGRNRNGAVKKATVKKV